MPRHCSARKTMRADIVMLLKFATVLGYRQTARTVPQDTSGPKSFPMQGKCIQSNKLPGFAKRERVDFNFLNRRIRNKCITQGA